MNWKLKLLLTLSYALILTLLCLSAMRSSSAYLQQLVVLLSAIIFILTTKNLWTEDSECPYCSKIKQEQASQQISPKNRESDNISEEEEAIIADVALSAAMDKEEELSQKE